MQTNNSPYPATHDASISVVIPSLNRGQLLLDTISSVAALRPAPLEIIVVDQTLEHAPDIQQGLQQLHASGEIAWLRSTIPSVVRAMNQGLLQARGKYVLFLDDDIVPFDDLIAAYQKLLSRSEHQLVAGRVIQPWDDPIGLQLNDTDDFSFNALANRAATHFIGANFLLERETALTLGGFDQNFRGTSHDYEREYSDRVSGAGGSVFYCGEAAVRHLKEASGGIRSFGHFLKTIKPHHAVGAYYYILRSQAVKHKWRATAQRLWQRVATRTHLRSPWWIPLTLVGDLLGIAWAVQLWLSGPDLIDNQK